MSKPRKTHGSVRQVFKREFADPEFVMMFQEERARSELALAVSNARLRAGLTQAELASKVETSQSVIARLESGTDRRMPTLPFLARIAAATGRRLVVGFDKARRAG